MTTLTLYRAIFARRLGTVGIAVSALAASMGSPAQAKMLCGGLDGYLRGPDISLIIPDPETGGFGRIGRSSSKDDLAGPFTLGAGAFRFWNDRIKSSQPTTAKRLVLYPGDALFVRWTAHDSCTVRLDRSRIGEVDLVFDSASTGQVSAHRENHLVITEKEQSDAR